MENPAYLPEGTLLQGGKYRIVRFIGAGGFGCTYEAVFELLGERVAIKEFFPRELCNRDATGRMSVGTASQKGFVDKMRRKFVDEARTLFRYKNLEGVVKVTDVFEENDTSYFVMDFIDGKSLRKLVQERGALPEGEALRIIRGAGQALQRVHERNCLHLDIKPDNIMLDSAGKPVLIDFGVSKQYSIEDGCNTSTLMGCTPGYAPLEQLNADVRTFLPATDVYSLGATLYTLATGNTPPSATKLFNDEEELAFPSTVSPATRRAIEAAMQPKVKGRPACVGAFLAMLPEAGDLGNLGKEASAAARQASGFQPRQDNASVETRYANQSAAPSRKLNRSVVVAIVAALAAVAAVVCWRLALRPASVDDSLIAADSTSVVADSIASSDIVSSIPAKPEPSTQSAEQTQTQPAESAKPEGTAAQAQPEKPIKSEVAEAETQPQHVEPVKPEVVAAQTPTQAMEPAKPEVDEVKIPASSRQIETAMIAAYGDDGKHRVYTVSDWDDFTSAQKAKLTPVGVQLTASGQQFIVALTDAGGGKGYRWEDKYFSNDCVNIPGLRNYLYYDIEDVKRDYNGRSNTNVILAYGRSNGIKYPAAEAASTYSTKGLTSGWYLPAAGQLWLMYQNVSVLNNVLKKINGEELSYSLSSTEYDSQTAWFVQKNENVGLISSHSKSSNSRVRPVAPVGESAVPSAK